MSVKPYLIGICGGSASGKTSIAEAISREVNGAVPIISQDWYYLPVADKSMGPTHNWDHPDSFDWKLINEHVDAWKAGESVMTPRHDYANYEQIYNVQRVDAAPVMVFEGILIFANEELRRKLDLIIYVKCDYDIALKRRIERDVEVRKYAFADVVNRYFSQVKPAFDTFIAPAEGIADFILYNNGHSGITKGEKITHRGVHMIAEFVKLKVGRY